MKRMKGVAKAVAMGSSSPSPYATLYEDSRIRLKHQTLMQDFQELNKETEDQKRKLQMMKQKKSTLLAEVRFLRQRYKLLMQNQPQNHVFEPKHVQKHSTVNGIRNARKERLSEHDAALHYPVPRFDLNRKGKVYGEREMNFDTNQRQKTYIRKEAAAMCNTVVIPDLNRKERIYSGKEATARSNTPIFDLNQISREEEELQANDQAMTMEEPNMSLVRGGSDEPRTDMKLSACRSVGNVSSRAGKRKISWQDQVALRV